MGISCRKQVRDMKSIIAKLENQLEAERKVSKKKKESKKGGKK